VDDKQTLADAKTTTDRKEAATAKNIAAAAKQPASTKDAGIDSDQAGVKDNVDASSLTSEEFDALPEATKSRMRGDAV
jgi:hypothetical protein